MPRPPSERVDEAFEVWSTEAERNDTKTAAADGRAPDRPSATGAAPMAGTSATSPSSSRMGTSLPGVARAEIRAALPAVVTRLRHIVDARKPVSNEAGEPIGEV